MSREHIQKAVAELLGTFVLMFIGCASTFVDQRSHITLIGVAAAWSMAAVTMIYSLGHISGAHFNPAVTVAFAIVRKLSWKQVPLYLSAQFVGATMACLSLQALFFDGADADVMLTLPADSFNDLQVIAWEIVASFILMWVISGAACDHRAVKNLAGVAIGAAIFVDVLILGKVTGASMNPARSIGPAIARHNYKKIWIYIIAPLIGTTSAAFLYTFFEVPNEPNEKLTGQVSAENDVSTFNPIYSEKSMELP